MAKYIYLNCGDCDENVDVYCDSDNAMMCPECMSIDNFEEVEDGE
jgi:ribosomal protein S27E